MARPRKFDMTADEMRDLYCVQKRSQKDIAESHGVSQALVYLRLSEYGIIARTPGGKRLVILDRDELKRIYVDERMSMSKVAKLMNCSKRTVQSNVNRYGLAVGDVDHSLRTAESNKARGGAFIHDTRGYIHIRELEHPYACNGYIAEHRLVVERVLGRVLDPNKEIVHHINLRKRDNWIENLAVLSPGLHTHVHKSMERALSYLCGFTDVRPGAVDFRGPVFWGGKYISSIDFVVLAQEQMRKIRPITWDEITDPTTRVARSIKENGLKYELDETVN